MESNPRDEQLWRLAKKRAGFQRSLVLYFIINAFLWCIWWFTTSRHGYNEGIPWPAWAMLGWGIGLVFQYLNAYGGGRQDLAEREYERLKKEEAESN